MIDMLTAPLTGGQPEQSGFIPNRSIEMIMLPPAYQARAREIVSELSALFQ